MSVSRLRVCSNINIEGYRYLVKWLCCTTLASRLSVCSNIHYITYLKLVYKLRYTTSTSRLSILFNPYNKVLTQNSLATKLYHIGFTPQYLSQHTKHVLSRFKVFRPGQASIFALKKSKAILTIKYKTIYLNVFHNERRKQNFFCHIWRVHEV